jgi:crotonobetainyl-CoA:carnitine CoA-transferase CaiB-like acyl-CoA transferase
MQPVLDGIRILEVSTWGVAPIAGGVLAEWGADVMKVEHPVHGDPLRGLARGRGPVGDDRQDPNWHHVNRGKRSLGIDLSNELGQEAIHRLAAHCDVFLTSFIPSARAKFRIDVNDIRAQNPSVVYARASGFGPRGPESDKAGFDLSAFWHRSGAGSRATKPTDDYPRQMPAGAFGDNPTALLLALGVVLGLYQRERTGHAPIVDTSLYGAGIWAMAFDLTGDEERYGTRLTEHRDVPNPLVNNYRTSDGRYLNLILMHSDRDWSEFCRAIGEEQLEHDPRFASFAARAYSRELIEELDRVFAARTFAEWREVFDSFSGAWSYTAEPAEVRTDAQALANGYLRELDLPATGDRFLIASPPVQLDEMSPPPLPAPELGDYTEQALLEAGYDWDEIVRLKDAGATI